MRGLVFGLFGRKNLLLVLYFYVFDSRGPQGTVESLGACKNAGLVVANGLLFGREGRWVRVSGAIGRGAVWSVDLCVTLWRSFAPYW